MKNFISLILILSVLNISFINRAEATIGFMMSSKVIKVVGGIVTAGSVTSAFGSGAVIALNGAASTTAILATVGVLGTWLGIIILDEKNGNMNFMPISDKTAKKLKISQTELDIYNSEVEELNTVKEIIEAQVSDDVNQAEVNEMWNHYKTTLSPETMNVASKIVNQVLNNKNTILR